MPRIPAVLAVLAAVAFCIGFNTVRYPVVWEMLKQPGLPMAISQAPDASPPARPAPKPSASTQPAPRSPSPAAKASQPAAPAAKTAAAPKRDGKRAPKAEPQPEFCTADGVCSIAGGPQATGTQGRGPAQRPSTPATDSPPDLPRDASLAGLGGGKQPDPRAAHSTPSAPPPSPERPKTSPPRPPAPDSGRLARVERPLVPVPDGPWPAPSPPSGSGEPVGGLGSGDRMPPIGGTVVPVGNSRVRPLPPVDDLAPPLAGLAEPNPAAGPMPVYPTTGLPAVGVSRPAPGYFRHPGRMRAKTKRPVRE